MGDGDPDQEKEGWEALEDDAAGGSLAPNAELEDAMREAADAVEARAAERRTGPGNPGPGAEAAAELEALRAEFTRLQDQYLRLQADFENQRRRTLRERQDSHRYGHENIVKDLVGTVDNLERAIDHARRSGGGDFESMLHGVELVHRELAGTLTKHGVSVIESGGEPFDPAVHEAMAQEVDDSVPANTVVRVFEKGYRLWDRLLRPARVVVSKPSVEGAARAEAERKLAAEDEEA